MLVEGKLIFSDIPRFFNITITILTMCFYLLFIFFSNATRGVIMAGVRGRGTIGLLVSSITRLLSLQKSAKLVTYS